MYVTLKAPGSEKKYLDPELQIERIDLQLLSNKLQILFYQEMQIKNNVLCVLFFSYHVTLLASFCVTRPICEQQ